MSTPGRDWGVMSISTEISRKIPAGWYPCREDRARRRWWNGVEWTDYYAAVQKPTRRLVDNPVEVEAGKGIAVVPTPRHNRPLGRFLVILVCSLVIVETVLALVLIAHNAR